MTDDFVCEGFKFLFYFQNKRECVSGYIDPSKGPSKKRLDTEVKDPRKIKKTKILS